MECLFCKIISGDIPSNTIYEDEKTLAFLDIYPVRLGHTLVIPKIHAQFLEELDDDYVSAVFLTTKKISKQIKTKLNKPATSLGVNNGKESGQEVPHLHMHIIPREESDGGKPISLAHGKINKPTEEDLDQLAQKLYLKTN